MVMLVQTRASLQNAVKPHGDHAKQGRHHCTILVRQCRVACGNMSGSQKSAREQQG